MKTPTLATRYRTVCELGMHEFANVRRRVIAHHAARESFLAAFTREIDRLIAEERRTRKLKGHDQ